MNRPLDALAANVSRRLAPSTGIATGLMAPLALGAPGNLDPGFADHGRIVLDTVYGGQAWSIDALDNGGVFVAGGDAHYMCSWYYSCYDFGSNFADELTDAGDIQPNYTAAAILGIEVRDAIRQTDGKAVMVGGRVDDAAGVPRTLAVYRLDDSGSLDTSFGSQGIFDLPSGEYGTSHSASSVTLDPDGRIVVSGSNAEHLIILRLMPDGTLDTSFGEGGVFLGPLHDDESRTFVERTDAAGYRITTTGESRCRIVALTAAGALEDSYGTEGIASVQTALGEATACSSAAAQADGSLLLSGTVNDQAFATRMLATGAPDPAFSASAITTAMTEATAIAVAGDGSVLVAGNGEPGAMIMRLGADGTIDASFGEAGTALIDLPAEIQSQPRINALDVRPDGRVLAAGGDLYSREPFVVQLLDGGDSAGVVSFVGADIEVAEGGDLVARVRRSGGKSGSVSVSYSIAPDDTYPPASDEDYAAAAGTLTWSDGDSSEREIVVPIHADSGGPEEYEAFQIALGTPMGGPGLGTKNKRALILPDGAPAGQFSVEYSTYIDESTPAQVWVFRNFYSDGPVSVTLTPASGSATAGADFDATPITIDWADQDNEPKLVEINPVNDDDQESPETFTFALSNPTGGAILGPRTTGTVTIDINDQTNRSGGGGSTGWWSLLLLMAAELFRSLRAMPRRVRA